MRNRTLERANSRLRDLGTISSSAGRQRAPGPDERPARAAEEGADKRQNRSDEYDPRHDPWGERAARRAPAQTPAAPAAAGEEHDGGDQHGRDDDRPALEGAEQDDQKPDRRLR